MFLAKRKGGSPFVNACNSSRQHYGLHSETLGWILFLFHWTHQLPLLYFLFPVVKTWGSGEKPIVYALMTLTNPNMCLSKGAVVPPLCPETPWTTVVSKNGLLCLPFSLESEGAGFVLFVPSFSQSSPQPLSGLGCSCKQFLSEMPSLKIVVFVVTKIPRPFSQ